MNNALASALAKLLQSSTLSQSSFGKQQQHALDEFARSTGAVRRQPAGRGVVYVLVKPEVAETELKRLSPGYGQPQNVELPQRSINVANHRNSKSGASSHDYAYLLMRSSDNSVLWQQEGSAAQLHLAEACQRKGVEAIRLERNSRWYSKQPLLLIENQALFDRLDWLPSQALSAVFYNGNLSSVLLSALALQAQKSTVLFFPDYDLVGLQNYQRIRQQLGEAVSLWLMPDWQRKLEQYGSRDLWQKQLVRLPHLNIDGWEESAKTLLAHMQRLGLALEQEAVWNS